MKQRFVAFMTRRSDLAVECRLASVVALRVLRSLTLASDRRWGGSSAQIHLGEEVAALDAAIFFRVGAVHGVLLQAGAE